MKNLKDDIIVIIILLLFFAGAMIMVISLLKTDTNIFALSLAIFLVGFLGVGALK